MKKWYNLLLLTVYVILTLILIALWIAIPEELTLNISLTVFNMALTLLLVYLNQDSLKAFYESQQFKKLTETLVFLFLIFSILALVNYWAYKHPWQVDLSAYKMNSLTEQSKNILKNLKGEVKFKLFARKQESLLWLPIFEFYRAEKNDITIDKIDIDIRPDLVADYQITEAATLVIEYKGKRQYVTGRDELNITNGLIKISRSFDPVVYLAFGHGEADVNSVENEGFKFIFEAIKNSAIDIRPLNLISAREIPFDAKALVIWGPKSSLLPSEIALVERFLARKGNLMLALDPNLNGDNHQALRQMLKHYGIDLKNDLVMDIKNFVNGSNGSIPLVDQYNVEHAITKNFKGQTFYPLASSLSETGPATKDGGVVTALLSTSDFPDSWAEKSIKEIADQKIAFNRGIDQPGPITLAMAYEGDQNKLVVFGNSSFVLNSYQKYGNNYALFLNSLSWLVDEDRLISFNLPIVQNEPMFISKQQLGVIFYFSVLFSPLTLFALSFYMYRRKRVK